MVVECECECMVFCVVFYWDFVGIFVVVDELMFIVWFIGVDGVCVVIGKDFDDFG